MAGYAQGKNLHVLITVFLDIPVKELQIPLRRLDGNYRFAAPCSQGCVQSDVGADIDDDIVAKEKILKSLNLVFLPFRIGHRRLTGQSKTKPGRKRTAAVNGIAQLSIGVAQ
jgi:hypothetical protein